MEMKNKIKVKSKDRRREWRHFLKECFLEAVQEVALPPPIIQKQVLMMEEYFYKGLCLQALRIRTGFQWQRFPQRALPIHCIDALNCISRQLTVLAIFPIQASYSPCKLYLYLALYIQQTYCCHILRQLQFLDACQRYPFEEIYTKSQKMLEHLISVAFLPLFFYTYFSSKPNIKLIYKRFCFSCPKQPINTIILPFAADYGVVAFF